MSDVTESVTQATPSTQAPGDNTRSLHPANRILAALACLIEAAKLIPPDDTSWLPGGPEARVSRHAVVEEAHLALLDADEIGADAAAVARMRAEFAALTG